MIHIEPTTDGKIGLEGDSLSSRVILQSPVRNSQVKVEGPLKSIK